MIKQIFDFIFAFILSILIFPIFILVVFTILISIGSPVIFRQKRSGLNQKIFTIYKFRTMTNEVDENNSLLPDELRLKDFGKLIRKLSIDEFPQLINIMRGEMSFVGPRPLLPEYLPLYTVQQNRRHEVKPGITGWAQINGRNAISWEDKFELDVWYVDNRSFLLDMKILFLTIKKVLISEGVSPETEIIMPRFKGSNQQKREK